MQNFAPIGYQEKNLNGESDYQRQNVNARLTIT